MIAVVTDSASDLPAGLAGRHQVSIVPAIIVLGDRSFKDGEGMSREAFYEQLPAMKIPPTTAAPSSGSFESLYQRLFDEGADRIVSIHLASTVSGIYNAARLAAEAFGDRVRVVDSGQISMGLGFQVLAAAETAQAGGSLPAVLQAAAEVRERLRVVAMVDSLEYLRRSGRVSFLRAAIGAALRMRVFVEVQEGEIIPLDRVRTRTRGITRLGQIFRETPSITRCALLHTNAAQDAASFVERYCAGSPEPLIVNVTTVIGAHVGPNALGFAIVSS